MCMPRLYFDIVPDVIIENIVQYMSSKPYAKNHCMKLMGIWHGLQGRYSMRLIYLAWVLLVALDRRM